MNKMITGAAGVIFTAFLTVDQRLCTDDRLHRHHLPTGGSRSRDEGWRGGSRQGSGRNLGPRQPVR